MTETSQVVVARSSREIVEECVELARCKCHNAVQVDQLERRATPRMLFTPPLRYCTHFVLSKEHSKPARMLDVSLGGVGLWCREALTEKMEIYVRLPLLDGKTAWVRGRVAYCRPDAEHYRAGIAFVLDEHEG